MLHYRHKVAHMKIHVTLWKIILAVIFFSLLPCKAVNSDNSLILAVHPFLSPKDVEEKFIPLANYLSKKTGIKIKIKVGSSYYEHIQYIGSGKVDIAYMGPASYVKLINRYGEKPVLAQLEVNGHSYFQGNIITRKNSGINSLADIKNKTFAFGDPNSTMSYIVPHYMLHQAGVFTSKTANHQFLYSHDNVALAVLSGDFDAGAVKPAVFRKYETKGLRTITKTPKISEHLFVSRSDLPNIQIQKLRVAMLGMEKTTEGLSALHAIKKSITGLNEASSSDYNNLRKIILGSENLH